MKPGTIGYFFALLTCLFTILILPSVLPLQSEIQKQTTRTNNNQASKLATGASIFNNNMLIAGLTLIPVVGWGYLLAVLWQTGLVIASYSQPFYWILGNPFAWVELSVFSYALLQSRKILHLIPQRKANDFKVTFTKLVAYSIIKMCLILLASAILEYWAIRL